MKPYTLLVERVQTAYQSEQALNITGASSKAAYGGHPEGLPLSVKDNQGIIDYDPAELVVVARAGTLLEEIQSALADKQQMLGFEPPFAARGATLGGAIASGLSGSGRPYRGGARDYLLGTKIINGKAQIAQFGGRVMKNVAGFDLFRPMAGAMGTLGVLLEVSLRVIPMPEHEVTVEFAIEDQADTIKILCDLGKRLPSLSASSWLQGVTKIRLSGSQLAVNRDRALLQNAYTLAEADPSHWHSIHSFEHNFFRELDPQSCIASLDLSPATPPINFPGEQLIDWGGARRYLKTSLSIESVRQLIETLGGSATLLQGGDRSDFFHPLTPGLMAVHTRLKNAFDPRGILNPGRLYANL
jgi:glycolate oxidase FAD binding subunit